MHIKYFINQYIYILDTYVNLTLALHTNTSDFRKFNFGHVCHPSVEYLKIDWYILKHKFEILMVTKFKIKALSFLIVLLKEQDSIPHGIPRSGF